MNVKKKRRNCLYEINLKNGECNFVKKKKKLFVMNVMNNNFVYLEIMKSSEETFANIK